MWKKLSSSFSLTCVCKSVKTSFMFRRTSLLSCEHIDEPLIHKSKNIASIKNACVPIETLDEVRTILARTEFVLKPYADIGNISSVFRNFILHFEFHFNHCNFPVNSNFSLNLRCPLTKWNLKSLELYRRNYFLLRILFTPSLWKILNTNSRD